MFDVKNLAVQTSCLAPNFFSKFLIKFKLIDTEKMESKLGLYKNNSFKSVNRRGRKKNNLLDLLDYTNAVFLVQTGLTRFLILLNCIL